jgi:hypothetical protein
MAKKDKAAKPDTKGKSKKADKDEDEATPEFKYGVSDIAEALDIKPASVRVQLRNKGIEKAGKSYGWNSKSELKEVIDQLKTSSKDEDDDDKPAKKSKKDKKAGKDKPAKKAKKAKDDEDDN